MKNLRGKRRPGAYLRAAGLLMMAAALLLTGYNLWDDRRAEGSTSQVLEELDSLTGSEEWREVLAGPGEEEIPDYLLDPEMEMPTVGVEGNEYIGTLEIPSLGLSLPVMSQWSYPRLRIAPCRYRGTAYRGNLVIAAHNYRAHFGRLGELPAGVRVSFTDVDGNVFSYEVAETQVLAPTDIREMEAGDWALTLFTCTLGGQSRVTVRCDWAE